MKAVVGVLVVIGLIRPSWAANRWLEPLVNVLQRTDDVAVVRDVLRGMNEALADRQRVPMPTGWDAIYRKLSHARDPEIRQDSILLSLVFGDPEAIEASHDLVTDRSLSAAQRQAALQSLVQARDPTLVALLDKLLDAPEMAGAALRALAAYPDVSTPGVILGHYPHLSDAQRRDAVLTLASRPASAIALLDAVGRGAVPKQDLTAFEVRQIANLDDATVNQRLAQVWGPVRGTSKDKLALLAEYKAKFSPDVLGKANLAHGRQVFGNTCGVCHTLFDSGGQVGPNLTGAQRANLDYVLGKVLDPSAVVSRDYRMTIIKTRDDRVINGIVQQETDSAVTLKAPNQTIIVQKADIERRKLADSSLMPEGLLAAMSFDDARDLLAYLATPTQVPLATR